MRTPRFSIIIPTLNEENFLPNLLTSLTEQTEKDFEVFVVDGSSKDKTVEVAKTFAKKLPKLNIVISQKASLPLQRNLGAQVAVGKWFVFADADSVLMPYFIERAERFIQEKQPTFFTTWIQPDSDKINDAILMLFGNIVLESAILFHRPVSPGPLTVVRADAFRAVGGYNEAHTFTEDLDLSLRLDKAGYPLVLLRETLYVYSLRRLRREGTLKVFQAYAKAAVGALLTHRAPKSMPGYIMGGHLYTSKKQVKPSALARYERKLKKLMKEFFE